eukprot:CAMPEP_0184687272 /NCGR_PEP_ID=MMETSP0312-20130426/25820_1 /TAXON_ID=31354 /ORGANISM="Compsopogon coeruleus, Strain SAG 36.94" /LENGTH=238 /DNA_ID=CAMNT_0027143233 /DNA_START=15 /DNA_END=731 /DNA_ORIENTATION=-
MVVTLFKKKKNYTRFSSVLITVATVLAFISLFDHHWGIVDNAPLVERRHRLVSYGLIAACYSSNWDSAVNPNPTYVDGCFYVSPEDCLVKVQKEGAVGLVDILLPPAQNDCRRWEISIGLYFTSVVFLLISSFLTFFTGCVLSPSLSVGAATAGAVGAVGPLASWAIVTVNREFTIGQTSITAKLGRGYIMAAVSWVLIILAVACELGVVVLSRRRTNYQPAFSDDDEPVGDAAPHND